MSQYIDEKDTVTDNAKVTSRTVISNNVVDPLKLDYLFTMFSAKIFGFFH